MQPRPVYTRFVRSASSGVRLSWNVRMTEPIVLLGDDVQARRPTTLVSLSRVGVTGVEKVVRIRANGHEQLFYAELECFVDLGREQKGAHMSRFEEIVNEAIDEVVLGEAFKAETLASHIAERVRDRQDGCRAEVTIAARYPENKTAPGVRRAHAGDLHAVRLGGGLRARHAPADRRAGAGHDRLPVRAGDGHRALAGAAARGRLHRRRDRPRVPGGARWPRTTSAASAPCTWAAPRPATRRWRPTDLLAIVEASMSSEIYELMKRPDEVEVVEKAHRRPRFVEDCVREMVRMATERYAALGERRVHLGPPGEPGDDPQAQRRGRAPRPDRRPHARDRDGRVARAVT